MTQADPSENQEYGTEVPEIRYYDGSDIANSLRLLASDLEDDDDLVLIGLWNVESQEPYDSVRLQVVLTHLGEHPSRGDTDGR